jgi:PAS domain S-box-containing protein
LWLDTQNQAALAYWLRHTTIPMLIARETGDIVWVNQSMEELLGYTAAELTDTTRMNWHRLTANQEDARADVKMAAEVAGGRRWEYQLQTSYITKIGRPERVLQHVLRYPASGVFDYFMVSLIPLDRGYQAALEELTFIRTDLVKLIELSTASKPSMAEKLWAWAQAHPVMAAVGALFVFAFIFGDRALEIATSVKEIFFPKSP